MQYLMKTGKDLVRGEMPDEAAQEIIAKGKKTKSNQKGYICIDEKFYFPVEEESDGHVTKETVKSS